ncbi:MAG TPA: 2-amino-4-hydroxy-6-hydroxymethyldihydropteridine diphosphokinase [Povalibacter sp.]|uniref:2-amino-4-hydroxy-6- hydroxymethyldihydropteridine diphosphokinase n=1 Tax=Povalibacter sp. TaxID=1962978 RepID=UPI002CB24656|nr:2-amino-4-hydroxy-6-hydroxymethyldihydropteridine diphosphokinase [Povalibacter sp.]HMN43436.1 2-amino-4-hydroxy-6-hydroxymethyldihydropteridine diphosphokinase [Povalibacter sp.]
MSTLWVPAYIAVGSNLDDPLAQVRLALEKLRTLAASRLIRVSRLYRSAPLGPQDQPEFVNAVAGVLTQLSPRELLQTLKQLEADLGRASPVVRWGPRRIDLDLLVHGTARIEEADLVVPHRGVPERNFVLYPLHDIAPDLIVPGHGSVASLAARVGAAGLVPLS